MMHRPINICNHSSLFIFLHNFANCLHSWTILETIISSWSTIHGCGRITIFVVVCDNFYAFCDSSTIHFRQCQTFNWKEKNWFQNLGWRMSNSCSKLLKLRKTISRILVSYSQTHIRSFNIVCLIKAEGTSLNRWVLFL